MREAMVAVGDGPARCIQLLAPLDRESTIAKFLDRNGPGIQQLAYRVDDVEAVSAIAARARPAAAVRRPAPRHRGLAGSTSSTPRTPAASWSSWSSPLPRPDGSPSGSVWSMTSALTPDQLERFAKRVEADPTARMMQNALATHRRRQGRPRPCPDAVGAAVDEPPAGRLGGHRPEAVGALLDVRRAEPAARRGGRAQLGVKEFEFSPELPAVLGQAGEGQPLARVDPRHRRPRRRRPHRRAPARDPGRGRRAVEHVRRPGRASTAWCPRRSCPRPSSSSKTAS